MITPAVGKNQPEINHIKNFLLKLKIDNKEMAQIQAIFIHDGKSMNSFAMVQKIILNI